MAILPGIFTQRPNTETNAGVTGKLFTSQIGDANRQALLDMIDGLSVGDTILGKVLSQSGKNLQIVTQDGLLLNAKNDSRVLMEKGTSILFEVQKKSGKDVSIRPLYQNTSIQNTAETALRQAGLPITNRSLEFTGRSMEYGNPIDRNSLVEAYKDVSLHPEASVKCIVDLQKMGLEINDVTISQYKAYSNMENSVSEAFTRISDSLLEALASEIEEMDGSMLNYSQENISFSEKLPIIDTLSKIAETLGESEYSNGITISPEEFSNIVSDAEDSGLLLDNLVNKAELDISENGFSPVSVLKSLLPDIANPVKFSEVFELENNEELANNSLISNENEIMPETNLQSFDYNQALSSFVSKDSVANLFRKTIASQWSLDKNKLGDVGEIKDLYTRLFSQTKDILNILNENVDKNHSINENINNLRNNIDFMNDLNTYVPYIQIPFHSEGKTENSELYVYTNKKNLASSDGEVSAFIHLDMDNLGPTDVYVKLHGEHVSTNFTVKDEDTLILIEHHLDILDRRLNEKGYSFESSVKTGKQEKSPLDQMLFDTQRHLVLADTSFDARV